MSRVTWTVLGVCAIVGCIICSGAPGGDASSSPSVTTTRATETTSTPMATSQATTTEADSGVTKVSLQFSCPGPRHTFLTSIASCSVGEGSIYKKMESGEAEHPVSLAILKAIGARSLKPPLMPGEDLKQKTQYSTEFETLTDEDKTAHNRACQKSEHQSWCLLNGDYRLSYRILRYWIIRERHEVVLEIATELQYKPTGGRTWHNYGDYFGEFFANRLGDNVKCLLEKPQ